MPRKKIKPPRVKSSRVDQRHQMGWYGFVHSGRWVRVKSSNVQAIKYDLENRQLHVLFLSGHGGYYEDVSPALAKEMFGTSSFGKFVHYRLKDTYTYHRH